MSNRRKLRPQHPVSARAAALDGARIPGGCDHCNAVQLIQAHVHGIPDVHKITVWHDEWCPQLAAMKSRGDPSMTVTDETSELPPVVGTALDTEQENGGSR